MRTDPEFTLSMDSKGYIALDLRAMISIVHLPFDMAWEYYKKYSCKDYTGHFDAEAKRLRTGEKPKYRVKAIQERI